MSEYSPFKLKSQSVHWELMFTKPLTGHCMKTQGEILGKVAQLVEAGKVRSTLRTLLEGFSVDNLRRAHELLESGSSIGKIVLSF